jgi:hypothetical protein
MATVTNAWTNDKPLGSEAANTTDDRLRQWRLDNEERLKPFLYGYDATDNVAPNNEAGIKNLPFYKQTVDPSKVTDYAHAYVKIVNGLPELFYQDDTSTTFQITTAGALNVLSADLLGKLTNDTYFTAIDNAGTGTTDLIKAGQNVAADTDVAILPDLTRMVTDAAPIEDTDISNKKYVDDAIAVIEASIAYSALTTLDSVGGTLTLNTGTEYRAAGDGFLMFTYGSSEEQCDIWVDTSSPPTSGSKFETRAFGEDTITIAIAKDEYFQFTSTTPFTFQRVWWRSVGTLAKPIKQ